MPENPNVPDSALNVWPPPPTNAPPVADTSPLENFRVQNPWLVLLLTIITLGVYAVFWLRRQDKIINALRPDLRLSLVYDNIVLVVAFISAGLDIADWFSDASSLDTASNVVDRIFGIMVLILTFQVRNAFNRMLPSRDTPDWFNGVYTWLLGVVYLQYRLNKNIRRLQSERQQAIPQALT